MKIVFKILAIIVGMMMVFIPWGRMGILIGIPVTLGLGLLAKKLWEMGQ